MLNYFKSERITSFLRQLDLYGFSRTKDEKGQLRFIHPIFIKGNEGNYITIKRKRQYQPEPKEIMKYDKMRQLIEALEREKIKPGKNQCESIRLSCLFKHLLSFQKFYGKNTEIYIRKFIMQTRFYFPELHVIMKKEFHCLYIKMGKEEMMESTVEELGINLDKVNMANKKELFVELVNNLTSKYHCKYCKNHINNPEPISESNESFVRIVPKN